MKMTGGSLDSPAMIAPARRLAPVLRPVLQDEFRDFDNLGAIAGAVRRGDAEAARTAGRRHVERGREALERALDAVDAGGGRLQ